MLEVDSNTHIHPKQINLVGPDGWEFSVAVDNTVETIDTTPNTEQLLRPVNEFGDSAAQTMEKSSMGIDTIDIHPATIALGGAVIVTGAILAHRALRRPTRFNNIPGPIIGTRKERAAQRRVNDSTAHTLAARHTLDRFQTESTLVAQRAAGTADTYPKPTDTTFSPQIDRVANFKKGHRSRKLEDPIQHESFTPAIPPVERTRTQQRASLRANLREDAINARIARVDKYRQLYGDIIYSSEDVDNFIANNRISSKEARSLRKASRLAQKLLRSEDRIQNRLIRQASGKDLHGRKISGTQKILRD